MMRSGWACACTLSALVMCASTSLNAATIYVPAGGNLQAALNAAQPGDTISLAEGAEFVGNFYLPVKSGDAWITVRTSAPDTVLPGAGTRIQPANAPLLARLRSPNQMAALRTAAGTHHWAIKYLEFAANQNGFGEIIQIGDGSAAQNTIAKVPHHIVLTHLYVHGDPVLGQKRGIALNASDVTIADSHVSECKAVGQDTQAIGGWNGPGPYLIENNYLEAGGENVLFGGADPAIPNLVPDGITVRRNHLSRPMAWKDPIVSTPLGPIGSVQAGGSLAPGAYSYRVVARRPVGQNVIGRSAASAEVTVDVTVPGSAVRVAWQPVPGATEYRVYGRTAGAQTVYWRVTTAAFVDAGGAGTAENVPTTTGTRWTVKNLFELKSARNVVVEDNIFENHWKESQPGYAIVLTPRNSNGACTWCIVEHVRFEYNIVRNVAAGINLTGTDIPSRPTGQSNDIVFRQNLFTGLNTSLGGNAWFMIIGDAPRDIVIEHNTIDSNGPTIVNVYGGTAADPKEVYGFRMVGNAARHGLYGMHGSFFSFGNGILNNFYPGAVFTANYLSGGTASRYPAGNFFAGSFVDQFVNASAGNFALRADSALVGAGLDGSDVGVDYTTLKRRTAGVEAGVPSVEPDEIGRPTAVFTSTCIYQDCTFADGSVAGSATITGWTWGFGDGSQGQTQGPSHHFPTAGTYAVTLTVVDANNLTGSVSNSVTVDAPLPPTANLTLTCTYLDCSFADDTLVGGGSLASWTWAFGDSTGATSATGTHAYSAAGTYTVTLTVVDVYGLSSTASRTVTVETPNVGPTAAFVPACSDLTCIFTDRSTDIDGSVVSWSWAIGASGTASTQSPSFTFAAPGTYIVALAITDDDGATSAISLPVQVVSLVHAGLVNGLTTRWYSRTNPSIHYWSADVTLGVHGADERPIAGATLTAAWSGALTKSVSCVTAANGQCTFKSGTLSMLRSWVTLTVTGVTTAQGTYAPTANHGLVGNAPGTAITFVKP